MDRVTELLIAAEAHLVAGREAAAEGCFEELVNKHYDSLTAEELVLLQEMLSIREGWSPFPGPQLQALNCEADELFYGGAAGGGKSDLLIGVALTQHRHSIIYRREATQLVGIIQRMSSIIGNRSGYNGQDRVWKHDDRLIEFGAVKDPGSEEKYQGRPHDLKGFDEITHFLENQYVFLNGWKRSAVKGQRVRTIATGNPPTRPEGLWVKKYWGPWLDRRNPLYGKVEPGELAYYFRDPNGKMTFTLSPEIQFDEDGDEIIPRSLTFIPSKVEDNPAYMETGYKQQLQSLPEPLRSQMLRGDFEAMSDDDPFQVIPTAWIKAAMDRWKPRTTKREKGEMTAIACDPARGGMDNTVIAPRYGTWYDELKKYPGGATPDGPVVVGLITTERKDDAPIIVDVIGIGASVVDQGRQQGLHVVPWNNSESAPGIIRGLRFANKRSWVYWHFRELLDPANEVGIELFPNDDLMAELAAHKFHMTPRGVQVWPKEKVKEEIGRSPDEADATVMASVDVPKRHKPRVDHEKQILEARDKMLENDYHSELGKIYGRMATSGINTGSDDDHIPSDYNPYD